LLEIDIVLQILLDARSAQERPLFGSGIAMALDSLIAARSQIVDFKDGEMSDWLKEHAWKLIPAAPSNA
jgi:hypothetical protein